MQPTVTMQPTVIDLDDVTGVTICRPCGLVFIDILGSLCPNCCHPTTPSAWSDR